MPVEKRNVSDPVGPATLVVLVICLVMAITPATASDNNKDIESYTNVNTISCGSTITVATTCFEKMEALPFCHNQTVVLFNPSNEKSFGLSYNYTFNDGNQEFIANITCYTHNKERFIVITNTNFGNCRTCEWFDFYSSNGNYLGSTDGVHQKKLRAESKPLQRNVKSIFFDAHPSHQPKPLKSIDIYRTKQRN